MSTATLDIIPDAAWRPYYAACAHLGPHQFYGRGRRSLCASCPASEPCLWAAMALEAVLGYRHGVWGGTSAERRQRIADHLGPDVDYHAWYLGVLDRWTPPRPGAA